MATQIQLRRGTTSQHSSFTGAVGEATVDTDLDVIRVHDGSTAGGHVLVGTATTQTLSNKTLSKLVDSRTQRTISGSSTRDTAHDNIEEFDCTNLTSLTLAFVAIYPSGRSSLFLLTNLTSNFSLTLSNVSWFGGSAPTLPTSGTAAFEVFKSGTITYAAYIGSV